MSLTRASIAHRVLKRLEEWPGVQIDGAACGRGAGVSVRAWQVLHLHGDREAELFLGQPVIKRMRDTLSATGQIALRPGSGWIRMGLAHEGDADLLLALVSVAIKAHEPGPDRGEDLTGCSAAIPYGSREELALGHVTRRLTGLFAGTRDPDDVRTTVAAVHHRFDDDPIRDFVPVLVERMAYEELHRPGP